MLFAVGTGTRAVGSRPIAGGLSMPKCPQCGGYSYYTDKPELECFHCGNAVKREEGK